MSGAEHAAGVWSRTLRTLIDQDPVTALVRGVPPGLVTDLLPAAWRPGPPPAGPDPHACPDPSAGPDPLAVGEPCASGDPGADADSGAGGDPAPDLAGLLGSPHHLLHFAQSRQAAAARAPQRLPEAWLRHLSALSELYAGTGPAGADSLRELLRRSAGGRSGRSDPELIARVVERMREYLPTPPGGDRPRFTVGQALSAVCGHRVETTSVAAQVEAELVRWCDPDWWPRLPGSASRPVWSGIVAELRQALRKGNPPTVAEAMARFAAASAVGRQIIVSAVPEPWAGQVTDGAYQPLARVGAGRTDSGVDVVLRPRHDPALPLTTTRLAYLLLIICHELDPGHAAQLQELAGLGARGAVLALCRPPAWFEGAGVAAECAAWELWPGPEVEWQVRFHRLRRLASAAMLLRLQAEQTEQWIRGQLGRLGSGYTEPVMAALSVELTNLVYAYGAGLMEASPPRG